jgi:O-acetyl-ADP-ribose deacetylase (regulator of RNase III)
LDVKQIPEFFRRLSVPHILPLPPDASASLDQDPKSRLAFFRGSLYPVCVSYKSKTGQLAFPKHGLICRSVRMDIHIVEGDLLDQDVEVIVNAWNRNIIPWWLLLPQGVSRAIRKRAGTSPFRELIRKGPIPLGGAVETGPGRLPFKAIIHVAGINLLWRSSEKSIRSSVRNAIALAASRGYRSIAFPLIGAGTGSGSPDRVLEYMRTELAGLSYDGEVRIVRYGPIRPPNARVSPPR